MTLVCSFLTLHRRNHGNAYQITKKWETSLQKEIPQDLHEMLKQQRDACEAMIEEKNKLIGEFEHVSSIQFY